MLAAILVRSSTWSVPRSKSPAPAPTLAPTPSAFPVPTLVTTLALSSASTTMLVAQTSVDVPTRSLARQSSSARATTMAVAQTLPLLLSELPSPARRPRPEVPAVLPCMDSAVDRVGPVLRLVPRVPARRPTSGTVSRSSHYDYHAANSNTRIGQCTP